MKTASISEISVQLSQVDKQIKKAAKDKNLSKYNQLMAERQSLLKEKSKVIEKVDRNQTEGVSMSLVQQRMQHLQSKLSYN